MDAIAIFPWDDSFETGVPEIDAQHRRLVELLNELASQVAFHPQELALEVLLSELSAYAVHHFQTEERIWHAHLGEQPEEARHHEAHASFVAEVRALSDAQGQRPADEVAEEMLTFLTRWLAAHILESDRHLAYVVLGLRAGLDLDAARAQATERMSGATKVLIGIILSIYETLSTNTLRLMRELAERKRAEQALAAARAQAEAASFAKSQFLTTMSHELRTPLNGIMGMAQLLQEPQVADADRVSFAKVIFEGGETLLHLVNDVFLLSRVETGELRLEHAAFDLRDVIHGVDARFAPRLAAKGLALTVDVAGLGPDSVEGDERRLTEMLSHLMSNALKFTERGAVHVAAREVERTQATSLVEISVTDTGVGVPVEQQRWIFHSFAQGDGSTTRRFGGAGLGLSIVRNLAQLMGGDVGVESEPGHGARFWFRARLDLAPAAPPS